MMAPLLPLAFLLAGCAFDEGLPEIDIRGTVTLPRAAGTRTMLNADGSTTELVGPQYIGPVFLGAYSTIEEGILDYPHPEMGPILTTEQRGSAYPYGGATVGRYSFACFASVACEVVTGRFPDFQSILDYFKNDIGEPVTDYFGAEVTSAAYFEQYCLDYFHVTTLQELTFLAIDEEGNPALDFQEDANGDFVAPFEMLHTVYSEGMQIWGWMDWFDDEDRFYSTCDENRTGPTSSEYNMNFEAGGAFTDVLNRPYTYIQKGDWITSAPFTMDTPEASPALVVDLHYE